MADSTNSIDIVLTDKIDSGIVPKLVSIGDAAGNSAKSMNALAAEMERLKATGLATVLDNASRASQTYAQRQRESATAAGSATTAMRTQAQANKELTAAASSTVGATEQEVAAFQAVSEAMAGLGATIDGLIAENDAYKAAITEVGNAYALQQQAAAERVGLMDEEVVAFHAVTEAMSELGPAIDVLIQENNEYNASLVAVAEEKALLAQESTQTVSLMADEAAAFQAVTEAMAELGGTLDALFAENEAYNASVVQSAGSYDIYSTVLSDFLGHATSASEAQQRLAETEQLVNDTIARGTALEEANTNAKRQRIGATLEEATASEGVVSANVSAAASMGLLEGRTLSMNRAAANFLTRVLPFGEILQAAFPIIGAVALISVLYQGIVAFDKWINKARDAGHELAVAFDSAIDSLRRTNDSLAVTNDKLDQTISKLEHKPIQNEAQLAIDQAREAVDRLDAALERVDKDLDKILSKNRVGVIAALFTGQAATGDTQQFVRDQFNAIEQARSEATQKLNAASTIKDPKAAESALKQAYEDERKAIQGVIDKLNERYNLLHKLQGTPTKAIGVDPDSGQVVYAHKDDQTANLTILGKSASLASEELRGLDLTMQNIASSAAAGKLHAQVDSQKLALKEAAAQWKALEAAFVEYEKTIAEKGDKITPQQGLAWWKNQEDSINPLNQSKLNKVELGFQVKIDAQQFGQDEIAKLQDQVANLDKYGQALKEATALDRIFEEAKQKNITLDDATIAKLRELSDAIQAGLPEQEERTRIWKQAFEAENLFTLAEEAAQRVMKDHPELADAITRELNKLRIAHEEMIDPLDQFKRKIIDQIALMGQYGDDLEISTQVQALANELRAKGVTNYEQEAEAQRGLLTTMRELNDAQKAGNDLWEQTIGTLDKLIDRKNALAAATNKELSAEAKETAIFKANTEILNQQIGSGQKNGVGDILKDAMANYVTIKTMGDGLKNTLQQTFSTLADGFADAVGRAIAYAKNFGQALKDVAREGLAELISGIVKLAIQIGILKLAKKLFGDDGASQTAQSAAQGAAVAAAWAPAAALVSLATLGANMGPALTALGVTTAVSEAVAALSHIQGHATGGWIDGVGTATSDSNLRWLSKGEYVVNAQAAAQHPDLLEAINSGKTVQGNAGASAPVIVPGGSQMRVEVHNYAGARVTTQQMDDNRMRILIHQETPGLIEQHAPAVISNHIANPNSTVSKSIKANVTTSRVR